MGVMNETDEVEDILDDDAYSANAKTSETGLDMSEILSVLDGVSTVFEVDKSIQSETKKVAIALMGEKVTSPVKEKKWKEKKKRIVDNERPSKSYNLGDELQGIESAKEKMDLTYDLLDEIEASMTKILQNQNVEYYTPLPKSGGFKGKIMYKIRSSVRRFLEYIFASTLKQQNNLNSWIARTEEKNVTLLRAYMSAVREECIMEIKIQERRNELLEEKLMKQEKLLNTALKEIDELKQRKGVEK